MDLTCCLDPSNTGLGIIPTATPPRKAPKTTFTLSKLAAATIAKQTNNAQRVGKEVIRSRVRALLKIQAPSLGNTINPKVKKPTVTSRVHATSVAWKTEEVARLVANARAAYSMTSSTVAIARTTFAKGESKIFRSRKIRDITGIEVTATAIPTTIDNAAAPPFGPLNGEKSTTSGISEPARKETPVAPTSTELTILLSDRVNDFCTSNPEMNINRIKPNQDASEINFPSESDAAKSQVSNDGRRYPSTDGPSTSPPMISPITRGIFSR